MKVSVLVPVYNLARFIEPCLLSLLEQQTDFEFEVIAIDDGSSDDSWSIMQRLARQWPALQALQNEQNMGLARTQKRLLGEAKGAYLAYVDGDDLALPGKLQRQADYLDAHPGCTLCYHEAEMFDDETDARIKLFTHDYYNARYLEPVMTREALIRFGVFVNASSIMFRRYDGMADAIDEGCKIILDYPWHILNLSINPGTLDFIPELLGRYRFHTQSFGGQTRKSAERREQSLRACCAPVTMRLHSVQTRWSLPRGVPITTTLPRSTFCGRMMSHVLLSSSSSRRQRLRSWPLAGSSTSAINWRGRSEPILPGSYNNCLEKRRELSGNRHRRRAVRRRHG